MIPIPSLTRRPALRSGFSLIELLVVIAVVAVLISMLLPAIGKARKTGRKAVSLSNMRQLVVASYSYREANRGTPPITGVYPNATRGQNDRRVIGLCTWSYGGKNCDPYWISGRYGDTFDVWACDRPLNPYIAPGVAIDPVPSSAGAGGLPADASDRKTLQIPQLKDPSDKVTHQAYWPDADYSLANRTCYDDVGTSYHYNFKWLQQKNVKALWDRGDADAAINFGLSGMKLADTYAVSRFVLFNDEWADIIVNRLAGPGNPVAVVNGYDEINKSVLGFLDGHASYTAILPGNVDFKLQWESMVNSRYMFFFPTSKDQERK